MSPNWLMLIGGLLWLLGELWGVRRNVHGAGIDTTSQWVWLLEARVPMARVLIGMFLVSLVGHLSPAHTALVP